MFFVVFSGVWAWNGPILHIPVENGVVVHYTNVCRRWIMIYCLFYVICVIFEIFVLVIFRVFNRFFAILEVSWCLQVSSDGKMVVSNVKCAY